MFLSFLIVVISISAVSASDINDTIAQEDLGNNSVSSLNAEDSVVSSVEQVSASDVNNDSVSLSNTGDSVKALSASENSSIQSNQLESDDVKTSISADESSFSSQVSLADNLSISDVKFGEITANANSGVSSGSSKSFTDLCSMISDTEDGGIVNLDSDIIYEWDKDKQLGNYLIISKSVTINANGHIIKGCTARSSSASSSGFYFKVMGGNFKIQNATLTGFNNDLSIEGSTLQASGGDVYLENCIIRDIQNTFTSYFVYGEKSSVYVNNCSFINNCIPGAGLFKLQGSAHITNCIFVNNTVSEVLVYTVAGMNNFNNNIFLNNTGLVLQDWSLSYTVKGNYFGTNDDSKIKSYFDFSHAEQNPYTWINSKLAIVGPDNFTEDEIGNYQFYLTNRADGSPSMDDVILSIGEQYAKLNVTSFNINNRPTNVTVTPLTYGNTTIIVNSKYGVLATKNITIIKSNLSNYNVTVNVSNICYGGILDIDVTVKDNEGNPVSENITISIDNKLYNLTLSDGHASKSISNLTPNQYQIITKVISTNRSYRNSTITTYANVSLGKLTINLTTSNDTIKDEFSTNLTAKVTDSYGNLIANQIVSFMDGESNMINVTTNSEGIATYTVYPNAGSHGFTARILSSKLYESAESNQVDVVVIPKIATKLTLSSNVTGVIELNDKINFTLVFVDKNNEVMANRNVSLYDGNRLLANLTTDNKGVASFIYSQDYAGLIEVKAVFTGDLEYYSNSSNVITIGISSGNSFSTLGFLIDSISSGGILTLSTDYIFNPDEDEAYIDGININKDITINGNGHKIDGNHLAKLFTILGTNVTFYNVTFVNSGRYWEDYGHAVISNDLQGTLNIDHCNFINNSVKSKGGISGGVIFNSGNIHLSNSLFENNSAISELKYAQGGAFINDNNAHGNVLNCTFIGNYVETLSNTSYAGAGALCNFGELDVINSTFINNYAKGYKKVEAGAFLSGQSSNSTIIGSIFINNTAFSGLNNATGCGGAIYDDSYLILAYNIFINNKANIGSAYCSGEGMGTIDYNYWGTNDNFTGMVYRNTIKNYYTLTISGNNLTYTTIPTEYIIKFEGNDTDKLPSLETLINLIPDDNLINATTITLSNNKEVKVLFLSEDIGNFTLVVGPEFNNLTTLDIEVQKLVKKNYTLTITSNNFTAAESALFEVNVVDVDGKGINGILYYTFNNETKSVELKDGKGIIDLGLLDIGNYTIIANYTSTDLFYNNASMIKTFNVIKANATIDLSFSNVTYGENGTVEAILPPLADGNLTFIIKDIFNKTVEVVLGNTTTKLPILDAGNYTIIATYSGNNLYNPLTVNTTFEISKSNTTLIVNISDVNYGDVIIANVSLTAGNIKLTGTVKVNISGKEYFIDVINGTGSTIIDNLERGNYDVLASWEGNLNTNPTTNKTSFNVTKGTPIMNVTVDEIVAGNDEFIRINLPISATGNITVIVDNETYLKSLVNGSAVVKVSGLSKGEHNLSVVYEGDDNYNSTSLNKTFIIKYSASSMSISADNVVYGNDLIVTASINTDATGDIIFTIGNISQVVKIVSGKASATFKGLNAGNYTIFATYAGDRYYSSTKSNTTANINKAKSNITLIIGDIIEGNPVNITAIVNNDATGTVTFSIVNLYSPRDKEIINGSSLWMISPLTSGEYTFIAIYNGNNNYLPSNTTKVISYNQTKTILDVDIKVNGNITINANLTTVDGEKLTQWVYVTIANNTYKVPVFNGTGYLNIGKLQAGIYNYTGEFRGTDSLMRSNSNGTFEVPSINLEVPYLVKYYSATDRLVAILTDSFGNPIKDKNITFIVKNKEYYRTTDENGKASMAINLVPGNYNVTTIYGNLKVDSLITIKSTILANNITKIFRNGTQFYAKFLNSDGTPLANTKVTFNINGVFYTRFTDTNGQAKLSINLNPGEYILTAMHPNGQETGFSVKVLSPITDNGDLVKYYRNDSQFSVKVIKSDGSVAGAGEEVTFNINGVFYKRSTNDDGIATLRINLKPGDYVITSMYGDYQVGNNVKILPTLTADDVVMNFQDGSKFKAKVVDGQGNPLANQNVTFNVNGVFYNRVSDDEGIASLNLNLNRGEYIITSMWNDYQVGNTIKIS